MKKTILSIVLLAYLVVIGRADDLNFSTIAPASVRPVSYLHYSMSYEDAIKLAKKTGKIIVITKNVENEKEIASKCEVDGNLHVNANTDTRFFDGLSKIEVINGEAVYVEVPSVAFPNREQGVQYRINNDAKRMNFSSTPKVKIPTKVVEIQFNDVCLPSG